MMTLRQFASRPDAVPTTTSWYLADLGRAQGMQELFTRQSPQKLKTLRDCAMIESTVSSNRIEGVEVDPTRIGTLVFGRPALRDRNEEELRGYRDALRRIHEKGSKLPLNEKTILDLHRLNRGDIWDAGRYKDKPVDIIEKHADGRQTVRFRSLAPEKTPEAVKEMVELWDRGLRERWIHPLILLGALNLDFLCIHPFRDGNGRVSRLVLLLGCYHLGLDVGRYISLERTIEENKERYYETLALSSRGWETGRHDAWPYINYLLFILKTAYADFEQRIGLLKNGRGEKTERIIAAIRSRLGPFRVGEIQAACPGVSVDMIRRVLKKFRADGKVRCLGRGQNAQWQADGELGNTH